MKRFASCLGALAGLALLSGCMTDGGPTPPSVTRFHLGQPIARAVIAIEPSDPADASSLEFDAVADAVARELTRLGWTVEKRNARSEQVAVVSVTQESRIAPRRSGFSIGIGGGTASYGRNSAVGVGGGVNVPVGRTTNQLVATQLAVRIQRRSDATVAWEGRADYEARAGTPDATRVAAASRLAAALFRDFPGESGRTIRVR
ncbi:MAG TPA: DUF4136 domain-containing protein [Allosphingosinicella sp.]|nr:DUF4136 domain-containing protein [Allosphingosinicella sp.]